MAKVLSIKISEELLVKLDLLVKKKLYKSRNDALRSLIEEGVSRELRVITNTTIDDEKINNIVQEFVRMNIPLTIRSKDTAAEIVARERER